MDFAPGRLPSKDEIAERVKDDDLLKRFNEINAPVLSDRLINGMSLETLSTKYDISREGVRTRCRREKQLIRKLRNHLHTCKMPPEECDECKKTGLSSTEITQLKESLERRLRELEILVEDA